MADEKFTPGAMRAAQLIAKFTTLNTKNGVPWAGEIISCETGDADLIAALEDLLTAIGDELPYNCKAMRNVRLQSESALRKAREGK